MAEKSTFIKIDRNIVEWRWFKDSKVFHVFAWLIIKANIKDHDFQKITIPRGSIATSYESIAVSCGMSISSVRRAIAVLEETNEIERRVRDHYQIIKIVNYEEYQGCSNRTGRPQPVEQPSCRMPVQYEQANRNNIRIYNKKNKKNEKNPPISPQGDSSPSGGQVTEIPELYRGQFNSVEEYLAWRNQ